MRRTSAAVTGAGFGLGGQPRPHGSSRMQADPRRTPGERSAPGGPPRPAGVRGPRRRLPGVGGFDVRGKCRNHPEYFCHDPRHFVTNPDTTKTMKWLIIHCNHPGHATPTADPPLPCRQVCRRRRARPERQHPIGFQIGLAALVASGHGDVPLFKLRRARGSPGCRQRPVI